jgi:hypothetical protein
MQENQNAFQNAGQNGYSYFNYHSVGNQGSNFFLLILAFILLFALLKSEGRYRKVVGSFYQASNDRQIIKNDKE